MSKLGKVLSFDSTGKDWGILVCTDGYEYEFHLTKVQCYPPEFNPEKKLRDKTIKKKLIGINVEFKTRSPRKHYAVYEVTGPNGAYLCDVINLLNQSGFNPSWKSRRVHFPRSFTEGVRPPRQTVQFPNPLDAYPIPSEIFRLLKNGKDDALEIDIHVFQQNVSDYLLAKVTGDFQKDLRLFLYMEELQCTLDMSSYDISSVSLSPDTHNKFLHVLKVPGLAEKRPSILRGDAVFVHDLQTRRMFKGYVHFVNLEDVRLSLGRSFDYLHKCSVHFKVNRTPFKIQHRALETIAPGILELLIPCASPADLSIEPNLNNASDTNEFIPVQDSLNDGQQAAVKLMMTSTSPKLVVVWGPPGTGKTFTLVEGILQIFKESSSSDKVKKPKILVCAPSNDAADLICNRILQFGINLKVFRLNAFLRDWKHLPEPVLKVSRYQQGEGFQIPPVDELMDFDILFSTCASASYLQSFSIPCNHFSHLIIDEAAQATEAEILVPMFGSCSAKIILAGDPKQLGPLTRSTPCFKYGFNLSLLERHIPEGERYVVSKAQVVMLTKNYRSHPSIVEHFSKMFYNESLEAFAPPGISDQILCWNRFTNPQIPCLFMHVEGVEARDFDSPSFYNVLEKELAIQVVDEFKDFLGLLPEEIGIITPYVKQVHKIKASFHFKMTSTANYQDFNLKKIKVGTVEAFQGDEKKLIIISCVRSSEKYLQHDKKFAIGFLNNYRRLNVSISRPKAALVVIGNAKLLATDVFWAQFISKMIESSTFQPCEGGTSVLELCKSTLRRGIEGIAGQNMGEEPDLSVDIPWSNHDRI